MKFGENSRKGASSLVIVMVVVIVALAGTLIYTALDRSVLTTDGYAMPGSSITYGVEINGTDVMFQSYEIVGYANDNYYGEVTASLSSIGSIELVGLSMEEVPSTVSRESINVNVPGLGMTKAIRFTVTEAGMTTTATFILNGLLFDAEVGGERMHMTDCDISVGEYSTVNIPSSTYSATSGSTITLSCISTSVDGGYLYSIASTSSGQTPEYYIGNASKIPVDLATGSTSYEIVSDSYSGTTLTISNGAVTQIEFGGNTYTLRTSN